MVTLLSIIPSAFAVEPSAGTRDEIESAHVPRTVRLRVLPQCRVVRCNESEGPPQREVQLSAEEELNRRDRRFHTTGRSKEQRQRQTLPSQVPREEADSKRDFAQRGIVAVQRAEALQEVRGSDRAAR
jgi:hypothetical protein